MQKIVKSLVLWSLIVLWYSSFALADSDVREACFEDLREILSGMYYYQDWYEDIEEVEYSDLEEELSRKYDNISSFWIDLKEPLFKLRLYSYWEETGYQHPPYSPYPAYEETEQWDEPANEHIIAEEFVEDPDTWEEHFIWCSFMKIDSQDLMEVTSENYWYDWDYESVIANDFRRWNIIWYNRNIAYDYEDEPLARFSRLFVFPEETDNNFFSKYPVKESFPWNVVDIDKFERELSPDDETLEEIAEEREEEYDEEEQERISTRVMWQQGIVADSEDNILSPMMHETDNERFPLFNYYQEIQNIYPDFGDYLALNWVVDFDVLKRMLDRWEEEDLWMLWSVVFDSRAMEHYARQKEFDEEIDMAQNIQDYYDEQLEVVDNFDDHAEEFMEEVEEEDEPSEYIIDIEIEWEWNTNPSEGEHNYEEWEELIIDAEPSEGWKFARFDGDCDWDPCEIEVTRDKNVIAVFEEETDEEETDEEWTDEEETNEEETYEEETDDEEIEEGVIIGIWVLVIIVLLILMWVFISKKNKKEE